MKNGKRQKSKQIKHQMFQQMKAATGESYNMTHIYDS